MHLYVVTSPGLHPVRPAALHPTAPAPSPSAGNTAGTRAPSATGSESGAGEQQGSGRAGWPSAYWHTVVVADLFLSSFKIQIPTRSLAYVEQNPHMKSKLNSILSLS